MTAKPEFFNLSMEDLQFHKEGVEDRIVRLQKDMKCPLQQDLSEQALELSQRIILTKILEAEMEYLKKILQELQSRQAELAK